jgi:hypothetical protein
VMDIVASLTSFQRDAIAPALQALAQRVGPDALMQMAQSGQVMPMAVQPLYDRFLNAETGFPIRRMEPGACTRAFVNEVEALFAGDDRFVAAFNRALEKCQAAAGEEVQAALQALMAQMMMGGG